jgi:pimeloyl-ACP methyl ester carboxylesterase
MGDNYKEERIVMEKSKKHSRKLLSAIIVFTILIIAFIVVAIWTNDYYAATDRAMTFINQPAEGVTIEYVDNTILYRPADNDSKTGLIFYPGALVQSEAYAPVLEQLAENGVFVVEIQMPHYLALLDANGARGIQEKYPEIENWYLSGHSLGGAMAALYANRHISEYEGVILLASYSTKDLSDSDLDILSIRGSNDEVINMEKYKENLSNFPEDYQEVVIEGGCHAYFGDYGSQAKDGTPTITVEEQNDITVKSMLDLMK